MLIINKLGERLREERERQGLTIEDVCKRTHIRRRYLEAIENGDFDVMPGEVYLKGFLRSYADALGLNGWDFVAEYNRLKAETTGADEPLDSRVQEEEGEEDQKPVKPTKALIQNPIMIPAKERYRKNKNRQDKRLVALIVLVLLAVTAYLFLVPHGVEAPGTVEIIEIPDPGETIDEQKVDLAAQGEQEQAEEPALSEEPVQPNSIPESSEEIPVLNTQNSDQQLAPSVAEAPVVVSLTALEDCWLEIYTDGVLTFTGVLSTGEHRTVTAEQKLQIRFGNPAGVRIVYNGEELTGLGSEVQTRVFTRYTNYPIQDLRREEPAQVEESQENAGNELDNQN